uniref:Uncharacterized protein n=1 Tax=Oryza brachyantha TaxID=4533 RepID=J3L060_ORYBR
MAARSPLFARVIPSLLCFLSMTGGTHPPVFRPLKCRSFSKSSPKFLVGQSKACATPL